MVEPTNIANPTILGSREISGRELMNAAAMSRITVACLTDSSADSRKAFLEACGIVAVFENKGTTDECRAQFVDR